MVSVSHRPTYQEIMSQVRSRTVYVQDYRGHAVCCYIAIPLSFPARHKPLDPFPLSSGGVWAFGNRICLTWSDDPEYVGDNVYR